MASDVAPGSAVPKLFAASGRMSIMFAGREKGIRNMSVSRHRDIAAAIETGDATLPRKTILEHMDSAAANLMA